MKKDQLQITPVEQKMLEELRALIDDCNRPMGVRRIARTRYNNILRAIMRRTPSNSPFESGDGGVLT
ncbi:hypothetical protein [Rubeoparvulum massiliense]|uniref:hypothetical protein n=1 Tax=Rubeoparvulum massiliense TaxID=1631346 RepID=UPI00065E2719|nr:hypothetical protein [Rubeoparvulum massiliense]